MVSTDPVGTKRMIRKHALTETATHLAMLMAFPSDELGDGLILDAPIESYECTVCEYTATSTRARNMHMVKKHGQCDKVRACVDTLWCPTCGMSYASRAILLEHVTSRSKVCKLNLLLRGPCVNAYDIDVLDDVVMEERDAAKRTGYHKHHASVPAVRIYGPCLPIMNEDGEAIRAKNGHPLGDGKQWFRPARLNLPFAEMPIGECHASFVAKCGPKCILCNGAFT